MFDFFYGWRRKVGCVLLVMAAAFLGGWIRSFYYVDWAIVRFFPIFLVFGFVMLLIALLARNYVPGVGTSSLP